MGTNWNTGGSLTEQQETPFYCEGDRALAQGGCGVSIFRAIQKPSEHGLGQPALGGPAWAGALDKMTSRGAFQPQSFCDSVKNPLTIQAIN